MKKIIGYGILCLGIANLVIGFIYPVLFHIEVRVAGMIVINGLVFGAALYLINEKD